MKTASMKLDDALVYSAGLALLSSKRGETRNASVEAWPHAVAKILRGVLKLPAAKQQKLLNRKVSWSEEGLQGYEEKAYMVGRQAIRSIWKFEKFDLMLLKTRPQLSMTAFQLEREVLDKFPCAHRMMGRIADAALNGGIAILGRR